MTHSPSLAFTTPTPLCLQRFSAKSSRLVPRKPRTTTRSRSTPLAVQQQSRLPSQPTSSPPKSSSSSPPTPAPTTSEWLRTYLMDIKHIVDLQLEACVSSIDERTAKIIESMRYSLLAGGKRIRPALAIAAYHMFAGKDAPLERVLPTALAVELIHTMSLIHDDLPAMDNDDFRRGKPTNHVIYGDDIAILAGDAMLAYSFEYVAKKTKHVDPKRIVDVISLLSESVGPQGLVGGQVMDIENEGNPDVDLDTLTWIHTHKTAALLRVSCACGAIVGGANEDDVKRVTEFAVKTGLAFQITDDVLDVTQSTEVLGKTAGKDEATRKATYPRLLGLDGSKRQAQKLITEAKECLQPYGERAETLLALSEFIISRTN